MARTKIGARLDLMMSCRACMEERKKNTLWVLHGEKVSGGIRLDNKITDPNDPKQDPMRCPECGANGQVMMIQPA